MLFKKKSAGVEWLVAGLGNPGKKYEGTRHNVGFAALDFAAKEWGLAVKKSRFDALCAEARLAGQKVLLLKPQTFMNLSGVSVQKASDYYAIPPERVIVLFDDVSLAPGALRIRREGGAGGHNGLKSIIAAIGEGFPRVKIGVGEKPRPEYDLADWVLSHFTQAEKKAVEGRFEDVRRAVELLLAGEFSQAMSHYNGLGHD